MKKLVIIIAAMIYLSGCGPVATFEEPQPANVKSISNFPKRMQGQYLNKTDQTILIVQDNMLLKCFNYSGKVKKNELDSTMKIAGDSVVSTDKRVKVSGKVSGDSAMVKVSWTDTIFRIGNDNVLKKFKGYYFLNILKNQKQWETTKLDFEKGQITMSDINTKEDLEKLKEITETSTDTVSHIFKPSKKQFRKFIKNNGFSQTDVFVKIKGL